MSDHLLPAFTGAPELNRVYHCDALTLLKALPDASVDIVVTSPPYNTLGRTSIGTGMFKGNRWIIKQSSGYVGYSDDMPEGDYQEWLRHIINECLRVSKGLVWVNHKTRYRDRIGIHPLQFLPFPVYCEVIWDRGLSMAFNSKRYAPSHEYLFGFGTPHYWQDDLNKKMSVWRVRPQVDNEHPCPFPDVIAERPILSSCPPHGIVLDPFFGSGTTGMAAIKLNRQFIGCDVSAEYVEIARNRLAQPYTPDMFALAELAQQQGAD